MSKLIVLSGVPGSGKSYISNLLKKLRKGHVYVIGSDDLRELVQGDQQDLSNDPLIWKMFYELAKVYALDKEGLVLLDACNAKEVYRTDYVQELVPLFDEISLVMFKLDASLVRKQNIDRDRPVQPHILEEFFKTFEDVGEKDRALFKHIYVIKEIANIAPIVDKIVSE